jgi:hypothetical protein
MCTELLNSNEREMHFTEPLQATLGGIHIQTHTHTHTHTQTDGWDICAFEMGMIYVLSFMKFGLGIQILMEGVGEIHRHGGRMV